MKYFVPITLGTLAACTASEPRTEPGGSLESRWTGADTGQYQGGAVAQWCDTGKYVQIEGLGGDTGIVVVIFPADTTWAGATKPPRGRIDTTPVSPAPADSAWAGTYHLLKTSVDTNRPTAFVVWRWADPAAVDGVRGDSGTVVLRRGADGTLSGDVRATGWIFGSTRRRVSLMGSFRDVTVRPASWGCPVLLEKSKPASPPRDSSVDSSHGIDLLPQRIRPQGRGRRPPQRRLP